jgi:hypothetical protein
MHPKLFGRATMLDMLKKILGIRICRSPIFERSRLVAIQSFSSVAIGKICG